MNENHLYEVVKERGHTSQALHSERYLARNKSPLMVRRIKTPVANMIEQPNTKTLENLPTVRVQK